MTGGSPGTGVWLRLVASLVALAAGIAAWVVVIVLLHETI
jgi:hypothetical protein